MDISIATTMVWVSLAVSVLCLVLVIWLVVQFRSLRSRQMEIFSGKNTESLEEVLLNHSKQLRGLKAELDRLTSYSQETRGMSELSLQKVGLIRFNPFGDTGGDQSFSIALLDVHNNGFVISSLHGRGNTRMYAKKIESGVAAHHLSDEEKQALEQALAKK